MDSQMHVNGSKRVRPGRRLSLRQVTDIQGITHEAALGLHSDFLGTNDREERARVASAISNLGKAWCSLQDAKREILGRPKAGVFKPERPKPKQKPYWALPEPHPILAEEPSYDEQKPPPVDEVKWEMKEVQPGVWQQVVTSSPGAAAAAKTAPAEQCAGPPVPQVKPLAEVACVVCGGKGTRRNSNFGIDLKCVHCKGTGRVPAGGR